MNLGLLPYGPACALQARLVEARKAGAIADVLLLCEHPHAITLGRNGRREHLRASEGVLGMRDGIKLLRSLVESAALRPQPR